VDRIELRGLRVLGTHGALPEEQVRAQPFEVDLDVETDLAAAGRTDALDDTLDYASLAGAAERVIAGEHHQLLERLAQRIADDVLADSRVSAVTVTVRKLRPPVPVDLATAAVTIHRAASNFSQDPPSEGGSGAKDRPGR
jgi:dihydroneopterin aldolase